MSRPPVLVYVEDNDGDITLIREAFGELGLAIELLAMHDGAHAKRYFQMKATMRNVPPPDAILLDFNLPGTSGADLLAYINASEALMTVPAFLFVDEHTCEKLRAQMQVRAGQCVDKPSTWDDQLVLARRLHAAMRPAPISGQS